MVIAFNCPVRVSEGIVIHKDVIGHQTHMAGQVPVYSERQIFLRAASDCPVVQIYHAVPDGKLQFAMFGFDLRISEDALIWKIVP